MVAFSGPYALIQDGVEIARHPYRITCVVEALDRKLAVKHPRGIDLVDGVEIKQAEAQR